MPTISVIVPMRDESSRIEKHIPKLIQWCVSRQAELVFADDGSRDSGCELALHLADAVGLQARILKLERRGKGAAVVAGLMEARGQIRIFVDADVPVTIEDLDTLVTAVQGGADLAVGDRWAPTAIRVKHTLVRSLVSFFASLISRVLTGLSDSQCGCKAWSGEAVQKLHKHCRIDGFASDLEQILMAQKAGLIIRSVPVHWHHKEGSRVSLFVHIPTYIFDVVRILIHRS